MVANPTEAEDLVQEAFLQVFRKIRTFRGEAAFSTWLHRLAVNIMFMHLRRKQLPVASLDEIVESQQESGGLVEEAGGPDPSLAGLIDRVNLERALTQLTWAHRMVFVLHDVVGYKHREIAGILDCSVGNSKALLHRARRRLRSLLQETFRDLPFAFGIAGHRNQSSLLH